MKNRPKYEIEAEELFKEVHCKQKVYDILLSKYNYPVELAYLVAQFPEYEIKQKFKRIITINYFFVTVLNISFLVFSLLFMKYRIAFPAILIGSVIIFGTRQRLKFASFIGLLAPIAIMPVFMMICSSQIAVASSKEALYGFTTLYYISVGLLILNILLFLKLHSFKAFKLGWDKKLKKPRF